MWESNQAQLRQQRLHRQVLHLPKYELPEPDGDVLDQYTSASNEHKWNQAVMWKQEEMKSIKTANLKHGHSTYTAD